MNKHLTEIEFIEFRDPPKSAIKQAKLLYRKVISKWATPEDWYNSEVKTISYGGRRSDEYWLCWSLKNKEPLPVDFLFSLSSTKFPEHYLRRAEAFDQSEFEQKMRTVYNSDKGMSRLYLGVLRHLLFLGKNKLKDITYEDVEIARSYGLCDKVHENEYYRVKIALYTMGITPIAPERNVEHNSLVLTSISQELDKILPEFLDALTLSRSIQGKNSRFTGKKTRALNYFFDWYKSNYSSSDLRSFNRAIWTEYIKQIKKLRCGPGRKMDYLDVLPQLFKWGWVEYPSLMPTKFNISGKDYATLKNEQDSQVVHLSFSDPDHGDKLIDYILNNYTPVTDRDKMLRAATIIEATTGARISEIEHLGYESWRFDEDEKVHKLILFRVDKFGQSWRPLYLPQEGYKALLIAKEIREKYPLTKRFDERIQNSYIHLFELNGILVVNSARMHEFLGERKREIGLVDEYGKPVKGSTHAFRHRFGRRIFDYSLGDIKVVQHLLGHRDPAMSLTYIAEDEAHRNAVLKEQIYKQHIVGPAKELLVELLECAQEIGRYHVLQAMIRRSNDIKELLDQFYNLGYGRCVNPCQYYRNCPGCQNYLATEDDIPGLMNELENCFVSAAAKIEKFEGDVDKAMENPFVRKDLINTLTIIGILDTLGVPKDISLSNLKQGVALIERIPTSK